MALSSELISQFAKLTNTDKKKDAGAEVKGTFVIIGDKEYVRLDGSEILTPVSTNVEAVADERVIVLIQDHMATVIKNITSPAARNKSVRDLKDEVDEFGNTIQQIDNTIIQQGNSIIQMENNINQQGNTINQHETKINQQGDDIISINNTILQQGNAIELSNNTIILQGNQIDSINNTTIEHGNNINSINNTILQQGNSITSINNTITQHGNQITQFGDIIESQGNNITTINNTVVQQGNQIIEIGNTVASYDNVINEHGNDITLINNTVSAQGSNITILNSGFTIVNGVLTGLSQAILDTITVGNLEAEYAKIDFSNIGVAAIEKLFTDSGIIQDLIVENGHITGELMGVTIKGDLIEGNTIVADKLVVLGEDGIYYKLNATAETVEAQQTTQNSLSGSIITASSITASKISVDDLVAFGATIAGFIIDEYSIHSETKSTIASDARGLYFDKDGQFYLGDDSNHVKFYKNVNDEYILDIRASQMYIGTSSNTIGDTIDTINANNDTLRTQMVNSFSSIQQTANTLTSRVESHTESIAENAAGLDAANRQNDDRYVETTQQLSETKQKVDNITNIFQITGGGNLIKNSPWYYKTLNIPNDWIINGATIFDGGQDDNLIGVTSSRGRIEIQDGSVQTANGNIINILSGRTLTLSLKYKNGLDTISKVSLYAGNDTTGTPVWTETYSADTGNLWVEVRYTLTATSPNYILKIESTTTGTGKFTVSDLMLNYGEYKVWELAAGEVFGSIIKLDNRGVQVTGDTANTETYMTTNGVNVFNKTTLEKITALTDIGIDTKNAYIKENIKQKKMMHTTIQNILGNDVYIEYIED